MNKQTKVFISISCVSLVTLFVSGYFLVKILGYLQIKRESIDKLLAQNEIDTEKMAEREILFQQYNFVKEKEDTIRDIFIQKEALVSTIEKLESLAQQAGVEITLDIQEGLVKKQKSVTNSISNKISKEEEMNSGKEERLQKDKIIFVVKIRGTYEDTIEYLDRLERMSPIASFESLEMREEEPEKIENLSTPNEESVSDKIVEDLGILTDISISFVPLPEVKE